MKWIRSIIVGSLLLLWGGETSADLSMRSYQRFKQQGELELFLEGFLEGMRWANGYLLDIKQRRVFCLPDQLALNAKNLKPLVDAYYEKRKKEAPGIFNEDTMFGAVSVAALQEAFPCK